MDDNKTLALMTAIIRLCGGPTVEAAAREAVEIGRVFGIEPQEIDPGLDAWNSAEMEKEKRLLGRTP